MKTNAKLRITDLVWNAANQPKPGTPVTFTVTLKNDGPEPLEAFQQQTTIIIYVDRDEQTRLKYDGGLEPGESITFDSHVWEAVAGNHVVTAVINGVPPTVEDLGKGVTFVKHLHVAETALPVPAHAAEAGMNTLVFSDDFSTLDTIDVTGSGENGYKWYVNAPHGYGKMPADGVELTENGIILKSQFAPLRSSSIRMMDAKTAAGWGFTHGYMEARFRMPPVRLVKDAKGAPPSIWANPTTVLWNQYPYWVELDFMEYWGDMFGKEPLYTVTLHHQERIYGPKDHKDYCYYWIVNRPTSHHNGLGDNDWHVMGWLWEEGRLTTYLDGQEVMTQRWSKNGDPDPAPEVRRQPLKPGAFALLDEQVMPVILNGVESWPMEVDYLNIWQKEGESTL